MHTLVRAGRLACLAACVMSLYACASLNQSTTVKKSAPIAGRPTAVKPVEPEPAVPEDLDRPLPLIHHPILIVSKSEHYLEVHDGDTIVRRYRVGLGQKTDGDKERRGDRRTPEGRFYITRKNPGSQYYKSLWISYPSPEHAEAGLREGLIGQSTYERILAAYARRIEPPQGTALGGQVAIHGGGGSFNWTAGCVAVSNADMDEIFRMVDRGTEVTIVR